MFLRRQIERFPARALDWLRAVLVTEKSPAPSATSLGAARKLIPINDVVARVGREPGSTD